MKLISVVRLEMCAKSQCTLYFLLWVGVKTSSLLPGLDMEVGKKRPYPFLYMLLQAISYDIFLLFKCFI